MSVSCDTLLTSQLMGDVWCFRCFNWEYPLTIFQKHQQADQISLSGPQGRMIGLMFFAMGFNRVTLMCFGIIEFGVSTNLGCLPFPEI